MTRMSVVGYIKAPIEQVFAMIANISEFPNHFPEIKQVVFLSEGMHGVGTRFRETREMNGKPRETELEVTEYVENVRVRMVADSHGTVWDSIFSVETVDDKTMLGITMFARAHKLLPKIMNPIFKGFYKKSLQQHVDTVKANLET